MLTPTNREIYKCYCTLSRKIFNISANGSTVLIFGKVAPKIIWKKCGGSTKLSIIKYFQKILKFKKVVSAPPGGENDFLSSKYFTFCGDSFEFLW